LICQSQCPNHAKLVDVPLGPYTEQEASAFSAGSGGTVYWDFPFLPLTLRDILLLQGSSLVQLEDIHCQLFVQWSSRVNGLCRQSHSGLSNVGLIIELIRSWGTRAMAMAGEVTRHG
jgi:hypothetical protein